jgi:hypothetical protein
MAMNVPTTLVTPLVVAITPRLLAMTTTRVPLTLATPLRDAFSLRFPAMMVTRVRTIGVTLF